MCQFALLAGKPSREVFPASASEVVHHKMKPVLCLAIDQRKAVGPVQSTNLHHLEASTSKTPANHLGWLRLVLHSFATPSTAHADLLPRMLPTWATFSLLPWRECHPVPRHLDGQLIESSRVHVLPPWSENANGRRQLSK